MARINQPANSLVDVARAYIAAERTSQTIAGDLERLRGELLGRLEAGAPLVVEGHILERQPGYPRLTLRTVHPESTSLSPPAATGVDAVAPLTNGRARRSRA